MKSHIPQLNAYRQTLMQNIFDTLVAACRDILQKEQKLTENRKEDVEDTEDQAPRNNPTREQQPTREEQPEKEQQPPEEKNQINNVQAPRQEKTSAVVDSYFEQDQNWSQFENAIINHIKIKNKPVEQIILIEQTSSDQSQQEQHPPNLKADTSNHHKTNLIEQRLSPTGSHLSIPPQLIEDKQPEKQSKELQSRPLKLICKPPETKTQTLSKAKSSAAQSKQIAQQTKKAEMTKQVLSKVNINELKAKLNFTTDPNETPKPPKQLESKPTVQQITLQRTQQERKPAPKLIQPPLPPTSIAANIEKQLSDFSININDERLPQQSKGKVAKKGGKNQRQIEMKPQLNQDQARILQRRKKQEDGKVDLGALTLDEVVQHCYKRQIISEQLYIEYIATSSQQSIINFINLFIKNNLKLWDFQQHKITIMDHRRLAQYLVRVFPQHYKIYSPDSVEKNLKEFLQNLYGLPQLKYKKLLESLDGQSKVSEWNMLRIKFQKYANVPVKILPLPNTAYSSNIPQTSTPAKAFNPPNQPKITKKSISFNQDDDIPQQSHKRVFPAEGLERTEKKRPLNAVYESKQRRPQQQLDNEMRLASLKNQLKRKKIS